ncbi:Hpt domain-containing protein, partial [Vibrio sp. D173a]|uniref:Hpt domain-containing protein n=1 Tax=Vibrio sp. D173a TaxID=2836349 RepID=UPI002552DCB5
EFSALFQGIEESFEATVEATPAKPITVQVTDDETVTIIDFKGLNDLFGDTDVAMSLLIEFEISFIEDWETIGQLWKEQKFKSLKTAAHRVKGAAKMVACDALANPLASIEALSDDLASQSVDVSTVEAQMNGYIQDVQRVSAQFAQELEQLRATQTKTPQSKAYSFE